MASHDASDVPRELERVGAPSLAFANTEVPKPDRHVNDDAQGPAYRFDDYAELVAWAQRMGS